MISVDEAKDLVLKNSKLLPPKVLTLIQSTGHTLARDILAEFDIPAFQQSSMDGYAIKFEDKNIALDIKGEMAAGTANLIEINAGQATRVFTGAPLPQGADTVVMQEKISIKNNRLIVDDQLLKPGSNVRNKGAEIMAGSLALSKGSYLSPASIGFLAGIGINDVLVYPMPVVSIIVTGNELQTPGMPLSAGQVYESNSFSLSAALHQAGITNINIYQVTDNLLLVKEQLTYCLSTSNIILLTGGVSVGDYDFVVAATKACGVDQIFHKVKQKPGKPLYFGKKHDRLVFGLPGNPAAVLSCFYNYVLVAIEAMTLKKSRVIKINGVLTKGYIKPAGLTYFLKGAYNNGKVTPLSAQESFQLSSFAQADCLICLEEAHGDYVTGDEAIVYLLPA